MLKAPGSNNETKGPEAEQVASGSGPVAGLNGGAGPDGAWGNLTVGGDVLTPGQEDKSDWRASAPRVNGEALLDALVAVFMTCVRLPCWAAEVLALWVVHTQAFRLRDVATYIGIISPEHRYGKTTLMILLRKLVRRPVAAASVSSPAFFRIIHERHPTVMIDEGEKLLKLNRHLEPMLNAGYKEGTAYVWRVVNQSSAAAARRREEEEEAGDEQGEVEHGWTGQTAVPFSCYCPKIIARIGPLGATLADRCIVFRMKRKEPGDKCARLSKKDADALREQCVKFVRENAEAIRDAEPEIPGELNDREAEIWTPLLAIGDVAGGKWTKVAREAAVYVSENGANDRGIAALLSDIVLLFGKSGADRMFSQTLVRELNGLDKREWSELAAGKALSGQLLAKVLHPYGIASRTIWIGKKSAKGYLLEEVVAAARSSHL